MWTAANDIVPLPKSTSHDLQSGAGHSIRQEITHIEHVFQDSKSLPDGRTLS